MGPVRSEWSQKAWDLLGDFEWHTFDAVDEVAGPVVPVELAARRYVTHTDEDHPTEKRYERLHSDLAANIRLGRRDVLSQLIWGWRKTGRVDRRREPGKRTEYRRIK